MSSIVSIASVARHARSAARRGQPRSANPYPPMDPAHAVWADCHAAAAACAGCDRADSWCRDCCLDTGHAGQAVLGGSLAGVVRRIALTNYAPVSEGHHA